ncbi:16S rRNA (cytosine(1402)-N(4))-methyltransferase RsmH [candidate division WWE3 bacterium]|uniref:Ribosomal RNA small subunit methyltransferase H n=1 Tax=candidate division WWE3 bacterium TaxID=2053526 RepID=A0A7X9DJK4_UNCKA|nr:16S rRNA (cytosine(1402)-N(4))-methyltransferase RsmH [candidate division WWE3 bacterium]
MYHEPVLKEEVIAHLQVKEGQKYIDATLGDGGHTLAILEKGGIVLGIDINDQSLERAIHRINSAGYGKSFFPCKGNFEHIDALAEDTGFNQVSGILMDLGYSSFQLDESDIGLSFLRDSPLDMRLNKDLGVTAADLVNSLSEKELTQLISNYSDEKFAKSFAHAIVLSRNLKKIQTTRQLADILKSASSPGYEHGRIHPATRTFQALRIVVNDELGNLERSLPRAARLLLPGGRMIVISFHSLEDRIVKMFAKEQERIRNGAQPWLKSVTTKPVEPTSTEVQSNARSRSAKMRVLERKVYL